MPFLTLLNSNETESCNFFKSAYATFLIPHRASGSVFHFQFVVFLTPHQASPSLLQPTRGNKNGGQLTLESIVYIIWGESLPVVSLQSHFAAYRSRFEPVKPPNTERDRVAKWSERGTCNRADPVNIHSKSCHDHCPDLFLGIGSLQLNSLATLVMANWFVSCQLDFIGEVRAVNLQS